MRAWGQSESLRVEGYATAPLQGYWSRVPFWYRLFPGLAASQGVGGRREIPGPRDNPDRRQLSAIDEASRLPHTMHMKRTNLVLDPQLLEEAVRLSGERTYSGTVGRALLDFVRRAKAGKILELQGQGLWDGDLGAMRGDSVSEARRAYRPKGRGAPRGRRVAR